MPRLTPMNDAEFAAFLARAIPRRAATWVQRGIWTEERALEASRAAYQRVLPQGRATPGHHFFHVLDDSTGEPVGEVWYSAEDQGGKLQFWVEWIQIEPEHRRRGLASQVLLDLETTARLAGAERIGLNVWTDNPNAAALYAKLGFQPANMSLVKSLPSRPSP